MENTMEFLQFVKECREKSPQISFPTIEIYWEQQQSNPVNETNQDEKTTPKKSKK
jgi:hypothetical protein